jgi:hypothetical protein
MSNGDDAHYAALSQRVSGLEGAVQGIAAQIGELTKAVNDRSRTPWATLAAFGGLMLIVVKTGGDLSLAPIIQGVERNRQDIASVTAGLVPRGEHEERWRSLGAEDENLQRQIDGLDEALGGTWNIRDGLETINSRLDRYDQRLAELEARP